MENNEISFGTYRGFTIAHARNSDGFSAQREGFWENIHADSLSGVKAAIDAHYKSRITAGEQKVLRINYMDKLQAGKLSSYVPRQRRWSSDKDDNFSFRIKWGSERGACLEHRAPWLDTDENRVRAAEIIDCQRQVKELQARIQELDKQMVCFVPAHDAEPANEPDEPDELDDE